MFLQLLAICTCAATVVDGARGSHELGQDKQTLDTKDSLTTLADDNLLAALTTQEYDDELCTAEAQLAGAKCMGEDAQELHPDPGEVNQSQIDSEEDIHVPLSESMTSALLERRSGSAMDEGLDRTLQGKGKYVCSTSEAEQFRTHFSPTPPESCDENRLLDFQDHWPCNSKNVLFLYPQDDHNNAFCINGNVCKRLLGWYDNACAVRVRRISSVRHALRELASFPDDSIKHAVVGGHGSGSTLHWGPGNTCGESHLCVSKSGKVISSRFLAMLSRKMHRHGSIFLDSCLSATSDQSKWSYGMNLAQWFAKSVGKGIRVFGSELSFSKVKVKRFIAWHAVIDVNSKESQKMITADGGKCPYWAASRNPDNEGDCSCPSGKSCRTKTGEKCPHSKGRDSDRYFLPMCAERWAKVSCHCE